MSGSSLGKAFHWPCRMSMPYCSMSSFNSLAAWDRTRHVKLSSAGLGAHQLWRMTERQGAWL